jgi:hypothetical protein
MGLPGLNYEVWNEPEGFWDFHLIPSSEQWKAYNVLYKYSSKGILEGDPTAKIGGPATRMNQLESFLNKYEKDSSQLDFISWHQYNDDYSFTGYSRQPVDKLLDKYNIPRTNMKYFITEYNFYGNGEHAMNDAFYNAGNLARIQNFFRADSKLSGLFFLPRNIADAGNNTGAFTLGGNYPKPSYNFFKLYSKMAGTEVNVFNNHSKINAWASLDNSQGYPFYRVLLWSFASNYQTGALVNTKLVLKNIPNGQYTQTNFLIDSKHGNYQYDLASNITPAGELKAETKSVILKGNDTLNYKMENGAVELIEFIPVN